MNIPQSHSITYISHIHFHAASVFNNCSFFFCFNCCCYLVLSSSVNPPTIKLLSTTLSFFFSAEIIVSFACILLDRRLPLYAQAQCQNLWFSVGCSKSNHLSTIFEAVYFGVDIYCCTTYKYYM